MIKVYKLKSDYLTDTYVDIPFYFDRHSDTEFIYTTTVKACIQALDETNAGPIDPNASHQETFNDFSDWLYEYFYEDALEEYNSEFGDRL
jgi:hypothetical protein